MLKNQYAIAAENKMKFIGCEKRVESIVSSSCKKGYVSVDKNLFYKTPVPLGAWFWLNKKSTQCSFMISIDGTDELRPKHAISKDCFVTLVHRAENFAAKHFYNCDSEASGSFFNKINNCCCSEKTYNRFVNIEAQFLSEYYETNMKYIDEHCTSLLALLIALIINPRVVPLFVIYGNNNIRIEIVRAPILFYDAEADYLDSDNLEPSEDEDEAEEISALKHLMLYVRIPQDVSELPEPCDDAPDEYSGILFG